MKKWFRKGMSLVFSALIMTSFMALNVSAQETIIEKENPITIMRADQIEIYYRYYNGVFQKRRWNATRGYWIDLYWINV